MRGNSTRNPNLMMVRESGYYYNDLEMPPFSLPPPVTCSHPGDGANKESPGLMCLYDLVRGGDMASWLIKARRIRIHGSGSRKTTFTSV